MSLVNTVRKGLTSPALSRSLQLVGACYVACQLVQFLCTLNRAYGPLRPRRSALFEKYQKAGTWALVTGASDGIGRSIAIELAQRGFNVVVVARTKSKLDVVAAEIESYGRQALAVPFDFSFATAESYAELYSHLPMEDISLVVNNVGIAFGDSHVVGDSANPIEEHCRLINVNCEPMVRLSFEFAQRLKSKRCGAIVNLSSLSAVVGVVPYLATYAGTKAFNKVFSDSLRAELKEFGVDVLTVTPGFVATAMVQGNNAHRPRTNFSIVNVDQMAKDTVDAIGNRSSTAGHRHHILAQWLYEKLPPSLLGNATLSIMKKLEAKQKARAAKAQKQ